MAESDFVTGSTDSDVAALEVRDLRIDLTMRSRVVEAVSGVSFRLPHGRALGIVGESGSGKTLTAMACVDMLPSVARISGGSISIGGAEVVGASKSELRRLRGKEVGVAFQDPLSALNPALRVGEQIAERLRFVLGMGRSAASERAVELLDVVGLLDAARLARQYPHELSGGMRQRAMFAIAISCEPSVLIADEPTSSLDVTTQAQIMSLIAKLRSELNIALVFISHDIALVGAVCDEIAVMYAGQLVEVSSADRIFVAPQHPYTRALLEAIPDPLRYHDELFIIDGIPPVPGSFPVGCRFGPRCAHHVPGLCDSPVELVPSNGSVARCVRATDLQLAGRHRRG